MTLFRICFIALYIPVLIAYFFSETSGEFARRVINKIIMATMFLVCGYIWFFMNDYSGWRVLALFGLFFAWLGDVLLLWSFVRGGISFMIGNVFFILYEAFLVKEAGVPFARISWFMVGFFILCIMVYALATRKWIDFGRHEPILILYMATTTGHGMLGLGLASSIPGMHPLLLGLGLALFMVSDYFLMAYKFKYHRHAVLRCNSGTYFLGMLLVALSFSF